MKTKFRKSKDWQCFVYPTTSPEKTAKVVSPPTPQSRMRYSNSSLQSLYSSSSLRSLFLGVALATQLFSEVSCLFLGDAVYSNLASNFEFTGQTPSRRQSPNPILVFVADVHMLRFVDTTGQEVSNIAPSCGHNKECGVGIGINMDTDEDHHESTNTTAQCRDGNQDEDEHDHWDDFTDDDHEEEAAAEDDEDDPTEEDMTVEEDDLEVVENEELSDVVYTLKIFLEEPLPIPQPRGFKEVEPAVKIMKLEFDDDESEQCSICFENFVKGSVLAIMPCSHSFHKHCAFRCLPANTSCPLCRMDCTRII